MFGIAETFLVSGKIYPLEIHPVVQPEHGIYDLRSRFHPKPRQ